MDDFFDEATHPEGSKGKKESSKGTGMSAAMKLPRSEFPKVGMHNPRFIEKAKKVLATNILGFYSICVNLYGCAETFVRSRSQKVDDSTAISREVYQEMAFFVYTFCGTLLNNLCGRNKASVTGDYSTIEMDEDKLTKSEFNSYVNFFKYATAKVEAIEKIRLEQRSKNTGGKLGSGKSNKEKREILEAMSEKVERVKAMGDSAPAIFFPVAEKGPLGKVFTVVSSLTTALTIDNGTRASHLMLEYYEAAERQTMEDWTPRAKKDHEQCLSRRNEVMTLIQEWISQDLSSKRGGGSPALEELHKVNHARTAGANRFLTGYMNLLWVCQANAKMYDAACHLIDGVPIGNKDIKVTEGILTRFAQKCAKDAGKDFVPLSKVWNLQPKRMVDSMPTCGNWKHFVTRARQFLGVDRSPLSFAVGGDPEACSKQMVKVIQLAMEDGEEFDPECAYADAKAGKTTDPEKALPMLSAGKGYRDSLALCEGDFYRQIATNQKIRKTSAIDDILMNTIQPTADYPAWSSDQCSGPLHGWLMKEMLPLVKNVDKVKMKAHLGELYSSIGASKEVSKCKRLDDVSKIRAAREWVAKFNDILIEAKSGLTETSDDYERFPVS